MWLDFVNNPESIRNSFLVTPDLDSVYIVRLDFNINPMSVNVYINTKSKADKIPKYKLLEDYNSSQIVLRLSFVNEVNMSGWESSNLVSIAIDKIGDAIRFYSKSDSFLLDVIFESAYVISIKPYSRDVAFD